MQLSIATADVYPKITKTVTAVDGYTRLSLSNFKQPVTTIDLLSGIFTTDLLPPQFQDDTLQNIGLPDPSSPERVVHLQVINGQGSKLAELIDFTITDNTHPDKVSVLFERRSSSTLDSFQIKVCYDFGQYENLQQICDEDIKLNVINALGQCFVDFGNSIGIDQAEKFKTETWNHVIDQDQQELLDLAKFVTLQHDPALGCGQIGFMLANQTQEQLVTLTKQGLLTVKKVEDKAWIGSHSLSFLAYMPSIDPSSGFTKSLDMMITLNIKGEENLLDPTFAEFIEGRNQRRPPVVTSGFESLYFGQFNQTTTFTVSFADPLALEAEQATTETLTSLQPSELLVEMIDNPLLPLVYQRNIDKSAGPGTVSIDLVINGFAAYERYAASHMKDKSTEPKTEGTLTIQVKDLSLGGYSTTFELNFFISGLIFNQEDSVEDSSSNQKQETGSQITQLQVRTINELSDKVADLKFELRRKYQSLNLDKPRMQIVKVTSSGEVQIVFTNEMIVPLLEVEEQDGLRMLQDQDVPSMQFVDVLRLTNVLQIEIIPDRESDVDDKTSPFTYSITRYEEKNLDIQLYFEQSSQVSHANTERVKISVNKPELIFDWAGQNIEENASVVKVIPKQYNSQQEATFFESIKNMVKPIETGYFSSDLTLNAILSGVLQHFWALIVSQQIVILVPIFAITMPANAEALFNVLFQIAAFEMIPTDSYYEKMIEALGTSSSQDLIHAKMESLGFETVWLLPNLGSAILFFALFPIMVVLFMLISCCTCIETCKKCQRSTRGFIFWNWPISFFRDIYVVMVICAVYNAQHASWDSDAATLNSSLAYILIGFLTLKPLVMQLFLYCNRHKLRQKRFRRAFQSAYEELDEKDSKFLILPLFFLYRRLLVPMSILMYPTIFFVHFLAVALTGLATITLLVYQQPFKSKARNREEMAEEIAIMIITYHTFCFTDWLSDAETANYVGFSLIGCVLLHLFGSLLVMAVKFTHSYYASLKRSYYRKNALKKAKSSPILLRLKQSLSQFVLRQAKSENEHQSQSSVYLTTESVSASSSSSYESSSASASDWSSAISSVDPESEREWKREYERVKQESLKQQQNHDSHLVSRQILLIPPTELVQQRNLPDVMDSDVDYNLPSHLKEEEKVAHIKADREADESLKDLSGMFREHSTANISKSVIFNIGGRDISMEMMDIEKFEPTRINSVLPIQVEEKQSDKELYSYLNNVTRPAQKKFKELTARLRKFD